MTLNQNPPSVYRLLTMARTHLRRLKDARAEPGRIADAEAAVLVLEKAAFGMKESEA